MSEDSGAAGFQCRPRSRRSSSRRSSTGPPNCSSGAGREARQSGRRRGPAHSRGSRSRGRLRSAGARRGASRRSSFRLGRGSVAFATRVWGEAAVDGEPRRARKLGRSAREAPDVSDDRESLRCVRDRPGQQVWEPASDLMSQIQRGLDFSGRGYELAKTKTLTILTQPLEEGRTLVSVIADHFEHAAGHRGRLVRVAGRVRAGLGTRGRPGRRSLRR